MTVDNKTDLFAQNRFPADFTWGVCSSAYQIEGATHEDGRGPSVWDLFATLPGKTYQGQTGEVAADHYHRMPEDVAIMRELGVNAYRFSVSWPRVFPEGRGRLNVAGLDFYDRLVDHLLAAGVTPFANLFHWDFPQALQDVGGWVRRETVDAFCEYADAVAARLGDRVEYWATMNEPQAFALCGHWEGIHAPGVQDWRAALQVAHHLLLAHGQVVRQLHASHPGSQVGIILDIWPAYPYDATPESQTAARLYDELHNRWYLDPVIHGSYPAEFLASLGTDAPHIAPGDMEIIATPVDFLGLNYYSRHLVRYDPDRPLDHAEVVPNIHAAERTGNGIEIYPEGLRELLARVQREYPAPAYFLSENGVAFPDILLPDGSVHDQQRQDYLARHLEVVAQACSAGMPLKGYFVWSLTDNFEWGAGYSQRYGLVYIDYPTQRRYPKDSAYWYRDVIAAHQASDLLPS